MNQSTYSPYAHDMAIIIVNLNRCEETIKCIESIETSTYQHYTIICIDNASTDGSVETIKANYPEVKLIQNERNMGVSVGRNQGIVCGQNLGSRYFVFIDNDAVLGPDTLQVLVKASNRLDRYGFISALVYHYQKPHDVYSAGGYFSATNCRVTHNYLLHDDFLKVDFVLSTCMLTTRDVIEKLGCLREEFFAYHEDLEWALRAKHAGYYNYVIKDAIAWHPTSYKKRKITSPYIFYYKTRNNLLLKEIITQKKLSKTEVLREGVLTVLKMLLHNRDILKITYLYATALGYVHFITRTFYQAPDGLHKKPEQFAEYRLRTWVYNTSLWLLARRLKRLLT